MAARKSEEVDLEELLKTIQVDPKFKKFRLILKTTRERLKIERDRNEALGLMANRSSRALHGRKQYSPKAIMEATANDLQARARLVEIRVKAKIHIDLMEEACDAIKNHLLTEYNEDMRKYGTVEQRKALIERVQGSAKTFVVEGLALIEMLDQIVKDIDQASYHLRYLVDTLKLLDGTKGKIV
jgi:hypothetical protein